MNDPAGFNPYLSRLPQGGSNERADLPASARGDIDAPGRAVGGGDNIVWQTRDHAPTAYENRLGDAIEAAFEAGADSALAMAEHLNRQGLLAPDGAPWSAASFEAAMHELGA